ncbi:MAG: hypothetical protein K5686_02590 [Lachnospiraceae bacterium]|nr:hypothetical protein [Lachnospiraceae bacterium]
MRGNRAYLIIMGIIIALLLVLLVAVMIDRNMYLSRREMEKAEEELRDEERKKTIAALFEDDGPADDEVNAEEEEDITEAEPERREIEFRGKKVIGAVPDMEGEILKADNEPENIIFVGDSRTVGMKWAVGKNKYKWIAESGMGYGWLTGTAGPMLAVSANAGVKMVFNLGVNDPGNGERYAEYINKKAEKWCKAGVTIYYVSVNPVIDGCSNATNEKVDACNEVLKKTLDEQVRWIDTNTYLFDRGFNTRDGLHYDEDTYRAIYGYILKSIEEDEAEDAQTE